MFGSIPGIAIFICGVMILLSYAGYLGNEMNTLSKDAYQTVTISNNFEYEFNDIAMQDQNFLPYFEIRTLKDIPKDGDGNYVFDIFQTDQSEEEDISASGWDAFIPFDYEKLSKYFEIQLVIRLLSQSKSKYVIAPFRRCTGEDFANNGY